MSRLVPVKSLAAVLAAAPDLKELVMPRLSGGVAEWLAEEVELCGVLPTDALEAEQRRVLSALSKAVREGRIHLRRGVLEPRNASGEASDGPDIAPREAE